MSQIFIIFVLKFFNFRKLQLSKKYGTERVHKVI